MTQKTDNFANLEFFLPFEPTHGCPCPFVFNVQKIKEVIEITSINRLPPVYHPFFGIYDLRGTPLPLLSLEFLMSDGKWTKEEALETFERDWSGYKIIVLDVQGFYVGVVAAWVGRILDPKKIEYLPSPGTLNGNRAGFVNGLIKSDNRMYYMLDIEYVLAELNGGFIEKSNLKSPVEKRFTGLNVLVAEDSRLFQKKALKFFESLGFQVTLAENGEAALRTYMENPKKFDLIFADIEMPIRNGVSFIQEVRRTDHGKDVPVIFNSSLSNEGLIRDITQQNLGDYIVKYDELRIVELLNRLLDSNRLGGSRQAA